MQRRIYLSGLKDFGKNPPNILQPSAGNKKTRNI